MAVITTSPKTRRPRSRVASGGHSVEAVDVTAKASRLADFSDHVRVFEARHPASGLHAIIAIHDTTMGPALGGCRMWPYASVTDAMRDALRLSRGMTFKSALAGLALGGGKAVIIGDPKTDKSEALFRAFGSVVESLCGSYVTGEDLGTSVEDMDWVGKQTSHVIGTTRGGGDPSSMTALGVCEGIKAALEFRLGSGTLEGVKVAVQGLGHVGYAVCGRLAGEGARLVVADIYRDRVARAIEAFDATAVAPEKIHAADADVFAPCAFGAVLNDDSIPELRCAIIGGSANNQLEKEEHGEALHARGVLYAPDYVINAGGLISASMELAGEDPHGAKAWSLVRQIGATLAEIFTRAEADGVAPGVIADGIASERIANRRRRVSKPGERIATLKLGRVRMRPKTSEELLKGGGEAERTIATFGVKYRQYLDPSGRAGGALPPFAEDPETLIPLYRAMVLTRVFDAKAMSLQRTGQLGTYPSCQGQEAVAVGAASAMADDDVLFVTYREQGAQIWRGVTLTELFQFWGGDERGSDYSASRRDFPVCVTIAAHAVHAVGVATAMKLRRQPRVAVCILGDGATSKGDFYESINLAGVWRLPAVFVVSNNQWAISVPRHAQTAAETLAQKAIAGGFEGVQVDGNDLIAVREAAENAIERARAGGGPGLIEALTYRLGDHTTADDASRYREKEEVSAQWSRDPIPRLRAYLGEKGWWTKKDEEALITECKAKVEAAKDDYLAITPEPPAAMFDYLYETLPGSLAAQRKSAGGGSDG